ncbi:MAG: ribonuclease protein component [Pseudomonadota bacterium]|jgi:ribonuclease P protein component
MAPRHTAKVGRLTRRREFLAVAACRRKQVTPGLILQARGHDDEQHPNPGQAPVRVGYTASKKVGGAVERNRARRRLRAAVAEVLAPHALPGQDYVLVARAETVRRPYADLKADLAQALKRLKAWVGPARPAPESPAAGPDSAPPADMPGAPSPDSGRGGVR